MGCRHSSVDLSAPSILQPRFQVTSTPSILFSIYIVQIVYLLFELECEMNKNKQKRLGLQHFFKKTIRASLVRFPVFRPKYGGPKIGFKETKILFNRLK